MLARLSIMVLVSVVVFSAALVLSHYFDSLLMLMATYHMLYNTVSIIGDLICSKVGPLYISKKCYKLL